MFAFGWYWYNIVVIIGRGNWTKPLTFLLAHCVPARQSDAIVNLPEDSG